jgi:hypothetical protein
MASSGPYARGRHVRPGSVSPSPPDTCGSVLALWRTEDWIAVVLGFLVITAVLLTFQWKVADLRSVVPTLRWTTDEQVACSRPTGTRRSTRS